MGFGSGIRDPGSGKNLFRIPDPGVKKAPDPGSGSATLKKRHNIFIELCEEKKLKDGAVFRIRIRMIRN
jgi:hypothetical protein